MLDLNKHDGWTSLMYAMEINFTWWQFFSVKKNLNYKCISCVRVRVRVRVRISSLHYFEMIKDQKYGLLLTFIAIIYHMHFLKAIC